MGRFPHWLSELLSFAAVHLFQPLHLKMILTETTVNSLQFIHWGSHFGRVSDWCQDNHGRGIFLRTFSSCHLSVGSTLRNLDCAAFLKLFFSPLDCCQDMQSVSVSVPLRQYLRCDKMQFLHVLLYFLRPGDDNDTFTMHVILQAMSKKRFQPFNADFVHFRNSVITFSLLFPHFGLLDHVVWSSWGVRWMIGFCAATNPGWGFPQWSHFTQQCRHWGRTVGSCTASWLCAIWSNPTVFFVFIFLQGVLRGAGISLMLCTPPHEPVFATVLDSQLDSSSTDNQTSEPVP